MRSIQRNTLKELKVDALESKLPPGVGGRGEKDVYKTSGLKKYQRLTSAPTWFMWLKGTTANQPCHWVLRSTHPCHRSEDETFAYWALRTRNPSHFVVAMVSALRSTLRAILHRPHGVGQGDARDTWFKRNPLETPPSLPTMCS